MVLGQEKAAVGFNSGFGAVSLGVSYVGESLDALGERQIGQECLIVRC
jgi:hypothetical protein